jgi:hypothetical protein
MWVIPQGNSQSIQGSFDWAEEDIVPSDRQAGNLGGGV